MTNPESLTVVRMARNGLLALGEPDVIDAAGSVPVLAADTSGKPSRVLLLVATQGDGGLVTVEKGDNPPATHAPVGSKTFDLIAPIAAALTELEGEDNDLVFTAAVGGSGGNDISITYIDPEDTEQELLITVTGTDIEISLATDEGCLITSTAQDILEAIEADEDASALVAVLLAGDDGDGVVTEMEAIELEGGEDLMAVLGPFASEQFKKANGDMLLTFTPGEAGTFSVWVGKLPRVFCCAALSETCGVPVGHNRYQMREVRDGKSCEADRDRSGGQRFCRAARRGHD